jgi:predicted ATP-grasp superfamily ATP-dependent carboligase
MEATILITDAQSRQALAAARSLGKAGLRVLVADSERITIAGCSRFTAQSFVLPHPVREEAAFMSRVEEIVRKNNVAMILPMTDRSLIALARHRENFPSVRLPFPDLDTVMKARDKSRTMDVARSMDVPVPATRTIRTTEDLANVPPLPVMIKPTEGSGSRGIRIVRTAGQWHAEGRTALARGPFLAQDILPREGAEIGCYLLCDEQSRVVAHLLQKRIRSFPARGGPSTLRETVHDERILRLSRELLEKIRWKGPAMVEWKIDTRDGTPKLLEINPRFWGSLEGTIAAGVDFPLLTYRTFTGNAPASSPSYGDGVRSRWFFPGDLLWLLSSPTFRHLKEFFSACLAHDDVWAWTDPLPFFGTFLIALLQVLHPRHRAYFLKR